MMVARTVPVVAVLLLSGQSSWSLGDPADVTAGASEHGERNGVLEDLILHYLAQQRTLPVTSITSVTCDTRTCEIVLTGAVAHSPSGTAFDVLTLGLWRYVPQNSDFRVLRGSYRQRESAPNAHEFVVGFAYRTLEDLSTDPKVAARQHAACAAVRTQDAKNNAHEETAAGMRRVAKEELEIAARLVGRAEAERLAAEHDSDAPLFRECPFMPSQRG